MIYQQRSSFVNIYIIYYLSIDVLFLRAFFAPIKGTSNRFVFLSCNLCKSLLVKNKSFLCYFAKYIYSLSRVDLFSSALFCHCTLHRFVSQKKKIKQILEVQLIEYQFSVFNIFIFKLEIYTEHFVCLERCKLKFITHYSKVD